MQSYILLELQTFTQHKLKPSIYIRICIYIRIALNVNRAHSQQLPKKCECFFLFLHAIIHSAKRKTLPTWLVFLFATSPSLSIFSIEILCSATQHILNVCTPSICRQIICQAEGKALICYSRYTNTSAVRMVKWQNGKCLFGALACDK